MRITGPRALFFALMISIGFPGRIHVLFAQDSEQAPEQDSQEIEQWGNWVFPKKLNWVFAPDAKRKSYRLIKNGDVLHFINYMERVITYPSGQQKVQSALIFFRWEGKRRVWWRLSWPDFQKKFMAKSAIAAIAVKNEAIWFAPAYAEETKHLLTERPIWFENPSKEDETWFDKTRKEI